MGINIAGGIFALMNGEPMHAAVHATLTIVGIGAYLIWRVSRTDSREIPARIDPTSELVDRLQQSVDKIALDVERVGEAQRFQAKLLEKRQDDLIE